MVSAALQIVQAAVSLSFLALGAFTVADWLRPREQSRGDLRDRRGLVGLRRRADRSLLDGIPEAACGPARATSRHRRWLWGDPPDPAGRRVWWICGHRPRCPVALRGGSGHRPAPALRQLRGPQVAAPAGAAGRGGGGALPGSRTRALMAATRRLG